MTATALERQLPRLSQYDNADLPEGGLDPLGLAAVAERISDILVPGMRARMSQPRFVTLAAIGALACQSLREVVSSDSASTFDLAFEWMVVEAIVRHASPKDSLGVPGVQKARRAKSAGRRLSAVTYLNGPRVFGFTGVYRPFAVSANVLQPDGTPGQNAESLVRAWEEDQGQRGFVDERPGSVGAARRRDLLRTVRHSLEAGSCAAPPTGRLLRELAPLVIPTGARTRERRALRELVIGEAETVRGALAALLITDLPGPGVPEHEIAASLLGRAGADLRSLLALAAAYERCATVLDNAFRRLLRHAAGQINGVVTIGDAQSLQFLVTVVDQLPPLIDDAVGAADVIDENLAQVVQGVFAGYRHGRTATDLFEAMLQRHSEVQAGKGKRLWLDEIDNGWFVRPPYRDQIVADTDDRWAHPMRLRALTDFLVSSA